MMDWRVRIAWWSLLTVMLLMLVVMPPEAEALPGRGFSRAFGGRGGGSRGGGSRNTGSRGSSSGGGLFSRNRNKDKGRQDSYSHRPVTSKPESPRQPAQSAHPAGWNPDVVFSNRQPAQSAHPAGWNPDVVGSNRQPSQSGRPAGWNPDVVGSKQQPSAPVLNPPHQAQPGFSVGSSGGSNSAQYPRQQPYNPNYHGTQQAPPPYSPSYHGTQQAPPPYSPPGQAAPAYNPHQPPPAYSPGGRPPSYPGYPVQQPGYPGYQGHQTGYPGYQGHQTGYPGYPGHQAGYPGYQGQQPGYPGYFGGGYHTGYPGGGYQGYQPGYAGSTGFGGYYPGGGSHWSPPGYSSSYGMMPGLFGGSSGGLFSSSYHSSPFGYSRGFFRPSFPTIIFLPIPHYHYPTYIPPRNEWRCDCYVADKTAICTSKLKDDHIPSCVSSSVTAVFIRSTKVDRLSADAFRHVPRLEYINITGTSLTSLPRDLFRDTPDLKHLLVQNNRDLTSLSSDLFRDASKLESVILDGNDIRSLDKDLFSPLTSVKRLNLAYNKIKYLPAGIFRDNRELEELGLSGNPLHIDSDTARELLKNNGKLRVLLMRGCKLEDVPHGLLRNTSRLEWLDLSGNEISSFPATLIENCPKLAYLGLANNRLKVLGSDVLHQRGGSLATLELGGNPWRCDCDLLPLAGWAVLRSDAVPDRPKCSSPSDVEGEPLQRWFHSKDAMKCGSATSSLRTDLNRLLSVARAIAKQKPTFFSNLLPVSNKEISFAATNYFAYAMAARTDADVDSVVWHWARLLEKVLDRRHIRYSKEVAKTGIDQITMDKTLLALQRVDDGMKNLSENIFESDPLATTTTKPPAARNTERPKRPNSFEPLVNFTYILQDIPENTTKLVDDGIEEELKILFGVINATNVTSQNTTASNKTAVNSTGISTSNMTGNNAAVVKKTLNATEELVVGLRSELREVLSTLLLSIDRAKWDAAFQKADKQAEEKTLKPSREARRPSPDMTSSNEGSKPGLTMLIAVFTLIAQCMMLIIHL